MSPAPTARPGDEPRLYFLPWLRSGATGVLTEADPLAGPLPAGATLRPWLRIAGQQEVAQPIRLHGPGQVIGLDAAVVVRRIPATGTVGAEPPYFAAVELAPADLPWRYTPAGPGAASGLRPWLVLVVVRAQEGVVLGPEVGAPLPVLRIEVPATASEELPDLADSAAWAHVQSTVPAADIADALAGASSGDPLVAVARLLCPRRLLPDENWLACLVPAFATGRDAGLGEPDVTATTTEAAWTGTETSIRLPVYHSWTFRTGPDGDFESLARRLQPDLGASVLGRVGLDVTRPGPPLAGRPPKVPGSGPGDFVGALRSADVSRRTLPEEVATWYQNHLEPLLDETAQRPVATPVPADGYQPERDDPVVAPPVYAAFQTGVTGVPQRSEPALGWQRSLNLDPQLRAPAGVGAQVVRRNAEALMASAWAQAGAIAETEQALDHALLSVEVGRSWARRVASLDDGATVQVTARLHPWVSSPDGGVGTLASSLARSWPGRGLVSAAFLRALRPATALARRWGEQVRLRPSATPATPAQATTATFLAATSPAAPPATAAVLSYAEVALASGAWTHDGALDTDTIRLEPTLTRAATVAGTRGVEVSTSFTRVVLTRTARTTLPGRGGRRRRPGGPGPLGSARAATGRTLSAVDFDGRVGTVIDAGRDLAALVDALDPVLPAPSPRDVPDLSAARAVVVAALDPLPATRARLLDRIPALAELVPVDSLPTRVELVPQFTDPLSADLVRWDPRLLVPGLETLPVDRAALLEADDDYVCAVLAGANHELARELLWREFPTSPSATFLHRFWDTGPDGPDDVPDISSWRGRRLGGQVSGVTASALSVFVVRGELMRRYPDARVYAVRAVWLDGGPELGAGDEIAEVVLFGRLDASTRFYGLPKDLATLRGDRQNPRRTAASAGWFVAIEEAATSPRFGLDAAAEDGSDLRTPAPSWDELGWGHLVATGGTLTDIRFAVAGTSPRQGTRIGDDPRIWGRNAAHLAAITYQRPFRALLHADQLLAGADSRLR